MPHWIRTLLTLALLAAPSLALFGCNAASGFPERPATATAELNTLVHYFTDDVIKIYREDKRDADAKRAYAEEVIEGRIRAIDIEFGLFVQELTGGRLFMNTGGDLAVLGLNAAGTVVGSESTKAILHAISGGLVGARASVDKNVFYDQTMPVLVQAMAAARKVVLARIRTGLSSTGGTYTLYQGLTDVEEYYAAGTLIGAAIQLNNQTGVTNQRATEKIDTIYEIKFDPANLEKKRTVMRWVAARDITDSDTRTAALEDRNKKAREWLASLSPAPTNKDDFAVWIAKEATLAQLDAFIKKFIDKSN